MFSKKWTYTLSFCAALFIVGAGCGSEETVDDLTLSGSKDGKGEDVDNPTVVGFANTVHGARCTGEGTFSEQHLGIKYKCSAKDKYVLFFKWPTTATANKVFVSAKNDTCSGRPGTFNVITIAFNHQKQCTNLDETQQRFQYIEVDPKSLNIGPDGSNIGHATCKNVKTDCNTLTEDDRLSIPDQSPQIIVGGLAENDRLSIPDEPAKIIIW